jgi:hypothetical protein
VFPGGKERFIATTATQKIEILHRKSILGFSGDKEPVGLKSTPVKWALVSKA